MKYLSVLVSSLVFALLASQAMAACPMSLTAEQMIDCIIAQNDCQQDRFFNDNVVTAPQPAAVTTDVVKQEIPQASMLATTSHLDNH